MSKKDKEVFLKDEHGNAIALNRKARRMAEKLTKKNKNQRYGFVKLKPFHERPDYDPRAQNNRDPEKDD